MEHEDLVGRLMADINPELLDFLRTRVNSFVKWDLIRFFGENPHTTDTAENVARYTGRNLEAVRDALAELAVQGVLAESRLGEMVVYSLTSNPDVRRLVRRFLEATNDRQFRVKAIYHIIRGMR